MSLYCLVMAGGQGTRFWPESTKRRPKQYLPLTGKNTLLEETLMRVEDLIPLEKRFIVTTKEQEELASMYGKSLVGRNGLIFEPASRNTAPCILLSLAYLLNQGAQKEDVVAILPSDHIILNRQGFQKTLRSAADLSLQGNKIVTLGISPYFPHTGFGYIKKGEELNIGSITAYSVSQFKEKPDLETAKSYLKSGQYYWNAGMFVSPIGLFLEELAKHSPQLYSQFSILEKCLNKGREGFDELKKTYQSLQSISIDYAVMEKSSLVALIPAQFDWNDLGSWDALESVCEKVDDNILIRKDSPHYFQGAKGNIISSQEGQAVAVINVKDLIIVSNHKALMVLPKSDAQKIKEIVDYLEREGRSDYL